MAAKTLKYGGNTLAFILVVFGICRINKLPVKSSFYSRRPHGGQAIYNLTINQKCSRSVGRYCDN